MAVVLIDHEEELEPYFDAWDDLARTASEPNAFFERWMLVPALQYLRGSADVRVALVSDPLFTHRLIGLVPLTICDRYRRLPLRHVAIWKHLHCFLCTPLLRRGSEEVAMAELLADRRFGNGPLTLLSHMHADGPVADALRMLKKEQRLAFDERDTHMRPVYETGLDGGLYLRRAIQTKHRRDIEKRYGRLKEQGDVTIDLHWGEEGITSWTREFLALEAGGWKGALGSALASAEGNRRFFDAIMRGGAERGALLRASLHFNGTPIAMLCLPLAQSTAFAWKMAYDETFSRWSPGVLLVIEMMKALGAHQTRVRRIDSCAEPAHPMLSRLWTERRTISSWGFSRRSLSSKAVVSALASAAALKRSLRRVEVQVATPSAPPDLDGIPATLSAGPLMGKEMR